MTGLPAGAIDWCGLEGGHWSMTIPSKPDGHGVELDAGPSPFWGALHARLRSVEHLPLTEAVELLGREYLRLITEAGYKDVGEMRIGRFKRPEADQQEARYMFAWYLAELDGGLFPGRPRAAGDADVPRN